MLIKTHLAFTIFFIIIFLPQVNNPWLFAIIALVSSLLVDVDNAFSSVGRNVISKIIQVFTRHRRMIHSLTFCILVSIVLAFFLPTIALAFFIGYASHLFLDSFTKEGITPFWPLRKVSSWHFKTGGISETGFFVIMVLVDIIGFIIVIQRIIS